MDFHVRKVYAQSNNDYMTAEFNHAAQPTTFSEGSLYLLSHFKLKACRWGYWSIEKKELYGNFQLMKWDWGGVFVRSIGNYLVASCSPAVLLVNTAPLAFLIHLYLVEEYVGLGVTTLDFFAG